MSLSPAERGECFGALVLLVASGVIAVWVRGGVAEVDKECARREAQLARLASLQGRDADFVGADDPRLDRLDGLFLDHEVVWSASPSGAFVSLRARPAAGDKP